MVHGRGEEINDSERRDVYKCVNLYIDCLLLSCWSRLGHYYLTTLVVDVFLDINTCYMYIFW